MHKTNLAACDDPAVCLYRTEAVKVRMNPVKAIIPTTMQSKAKSPDAYLASLPDDRREALTTIRAVVRKNMSTGIEEGMQYGMIGYYVPHSVFPAGYHCDPKQPLPYLALASQKNHMAVYFMGLYGDAENEAWFREQWTKATGKKPDMGKCCLRFKRIDDAGVKVIGKLVKRVSAKKYIARYEKALESMGKRSTSRKTAKKQTKTGVRKKVAAGPTKKKTASTTRKKIGKKATARKTTDRKKARR